MAIIPKPQFPNVPRAPGVPQVARSSLFPPAPAPILGLGLALGRLWQSIFIAPQWAIYKSNPTGAQDAATEGNLGTVTVRSNRTPVVVPDSFGEFSYRNDWSVSDFPVAPDSFASYNKVAQPYEIMIRMCKGGTKEARKKFLDSIEAIAGTLDFYDIVTPERTYLNVNVTRYEVTRRGTRGAYFLAEVDLFFREIRVASAVYTSTAVVSSNAQNPSAKPVSNNGVVQAQPVNAVPAEFGL